MQKSSSESPLQIIDFFLKSIETLFLRKKYDGKEMDNMKKVRFKMAQRSVKMFMCHMLLEFVYS